MVCLMFFRRNSSCAALDLIALSPFVFKYRTFLPDLAVASAIAESVASSTLSFDLFINGSTQIKPEELASGGSSLFLDLLTCRQSITRRAYLAAPFVGWFNGKNVFPMQVKCQVFPWFKIYSWNCTGLRSRQMDAFALNTSIALRETVAVTTWWRTW